MKTNKSLIHIGGLYFHPRYFVDEANKTIGHPALSEQTILNRRLVTSKITEPAEAIMQVIQCEMMRDFGVEVKFKWSRYCGCTSCPCSPGFRIIMVKDQGSHYRYFNYFGTSTRRDRYGIDIHVKEDGTIEYRYPEMGMFIETLKGVCNANAS